jgi:hypothetical protein
MKPTIRVSVSDLDAYRSYLLDEERGLPELLARLRREDEKTLGMVAGSALHKALELAAEGETLHLEADGFVFTFAGDFEIPLSRAREIPISADYPTPHGIVHVRGRVDEINGLEVVDHKTTGRIDLERLMDSYQWRLYLDIIGAATFRWNILEMKRLGCADPSDEREFYEVTNIQTLRQVRYPGIHEDTTRLCESFAAFATDHLRERIVTDID